MRFLLSTIGSRGDVQPLVALALELRALGQQVRLCAPPDFRDLIESFGIAATSIGPAVRDAGASAARGAAVAPSPEDLRRVIDAMMATQFETIAATAEGCDVILAATALQVAARSVAERMKIGYVFAAYSPAVLPSPHHAPPRLPPVPERTPPPPTTDNRELWARDAERMNATFGASLNAHRAAAGLPPVTDVRRHMFTDRPWLNADPTLAPWPGPSDCRVVQTGAWMLHNDRPLAPGLEAFLDAGEPPVYFGFGSTHMAADFRTIVLQSARAAGRRAIVSRGWTGLAVAHGEPGCLVVGEANLLALFKRVAAVVHHGGVGTTTTAALAGAPQVVIPQKYDQYDWARRMDALLSWRIPDSSAFPRFRDLGRLVPCATWRSCFFISWRRSPDSPVLAARVPWWPNPSTSSTNC